MELLFKVIRGFFFPFRFLYLVFYDRSMRHRRDQYLQKNNLPQD